MERKYYKLNRGRIYHEFPYKTIKRKLLLGQEVVIEKLLPDINGNLFTVKVWNFDKQTSLFFSTAYIDNFLSFIRTMHDPKSFINNINIDKIAGKKASYNGKEYNIEGFNKMKNKEGLITEFKINLNNIDGRVELTLSDNIITKLKIWE